MFYVIFTLKKKSPQKNPHVEDPKESSRGGPKRRLYIFYLGIKVILLAVPGLVLSTVPSIVNSCNTGEVLVTPFVVCDILKATYCFDLTKLVVFLVPATAGKLPSFNTTVCAHG
tara:strand:+ start:162 stop:503 length:342 start_codon:yes stop_codon:yes gene_type:complete